MTTPTTELDTRFSEPGAQPTSWEQTRQLIEQADLFWISTVRADGRPHVTPLVAVWLDDTLYFCTGAEEQKGHNLSVNQQVALTTGGNDWQGGVDVVIEGRAVNVSDHALLTRLANAWAGKWDGRWRFRAGTAGFEHPDGGTALVFAVTPTKILAFAKGTFAHTRHQF